MKFRIASENDKKYYAKMAERKFPGAAKLFEGNIILARNNRVEIFKVSDELLKIYKLLREYREPYCFSNFIGEATKKFRISLMAIHEYVKLGKRIVRINEKAEQLFLYGRDVFSSSIVSHTNDFDEGDYVMVCNDKGEALGVGQAMAPAQIINELGDFIAVKNLMDLGWYLRHEE